MPPSVKTRIHTDDDLHQGARLAAPDPHHLRNVLRLAVGDEVGVFNGRDGEWRGRIAAVEKRGVTIEIEARVADQQPAGSVGLAFAPIRRQRLEVMIEKAAELGVARLTPVVTARTQGGDVRTDRLAAIARAAAEQCGRQSVPDIADPAPLAAWLDAASDRTVIWADETGGGRPLADVAQETARGTDVRPVTLLIGPEGGFAPDELDLLRSLPFVWPVDLGPRILRAETAAIAALACWQAIAGDWHR